jgi:hypothetical protein
MTKECTRISHAKGGERTVISNFVGKGRRGRKRADGTVGRGVRLTRRKPAKKPKHCKLCKDYDGSKAHHVKTFGHRERKGTVLAFRGPIQTVGGRGNCRTCGKIVSEKSRHIKKCFLLYAAREKERKKKEREAYHKLSYVHEKIPDVYGLINLWGIYDASGSRYFLVDETGRCEIEEIKGAASGDVVRLRRTTHNRQKAGWLVALGCTSVCVFNQKGQLKSGKIKTWTEDDKANLSTLIEKAKAVFPQIDGRMPRTPRSKAVTPNSKIATRTNTPKQRIPIGIIPNGLKSKAKLNFGATSYPKSSRCSLVNLIE